MKRRDILAGVAALFVAGAARAQSWPVRPIRLVVPFPPGGSVDTVARLVAPRIADALGQQVVIENKGGAGGMVGTAEAARAAPDGYTAVMVFDTHATNHHLVARPSFDTFADLSAISLMTTAPLVLSVSNKLGVKTLAELVARAKAAPGSVSFAHPGIGSSNQLAALQLGDVAGIRLTEVPYRGAGPMVNDLLGGHVDMAFTTISAVVGQVREGLLVALAVGSQAEVPSLPGVPTIAAAYPGFTARAWAGMLVPAGTPKEIVERLHRVTVEALSDPAVKTKLEEFGFVVEASGPAEFDRFVRAESDTWGAVIRRHGITAAN